MKQAIRRTNYDIVCVYFASNPQWHVWAKGLKASIRANAPNARLILIQLDANEVQHTPQTPTGVRFGHLANHRKLQEWKRYMSTATRPTVFVDADLIVLGELEDGFSRASITLTSRKGSWVNAGVIFARPGHKTTLFFSEWCKMDERFIHYPKLRKHVNRSKHVPGQNQASLRELYDTRQDIQKFIDWVPCDVWNACEDVYWHKWEQARIIHVKGGLRILTEQTLNGGRVSSMFKPLITRILPYYK